MSTVVVTGAGSGIGEAVALRFASEGWHVALVGRREAALEATAARAGDVNGRVALFPCDVSDAGSVKTMGTAVLARFSGVDVLVNADRKSVV